MSDPTPTTPAPPRRQRKARQYARRLLRRAFARLDEPEPRRRHLTLTTDEALAVAMLASRRLPPPDLTRSALRQLAREVSTAGERRAAWCAVVAQLDEDADR